jgi:hypothetical protein
MIEKNAAENSEYVEKGWRAEAGNFTDLRYFNSPLCPNADFFKMSS